MNMPNSTVGGPSICFVTTDLAGVVRNGGIGTHFYLMSKVLASHGWQVTILLCGNVDRPDQVPLVQQHFVKEGIRLVWIKGSDQPSITRFGDEEPMIHLSQMAFEWLAEQEKICHFHIIEFQDWGALGFRSIQAKRSGIGFCRSLLAVKLHSPSQWQREGNCDLMNAREIRMEFCERYAFDFADIQLSPSEYMLNWAVEAGWFVKEGALVAYPYPFKELLATKRKNEIKELVFFGRLERRKGLDIFLEALDLLATVPKVVFLGRDTNIDGKQATKIIAERMGTRPYIILDKCNREEALAELREGDRLAIIASRNETFGFTVAECVINKIPFLASRVGGIPEALGYPEGRTHWLFELAPQALADAIRARLCADEVEQLRLRDEAAKICDDTRWNSLIAAKYLDLLKGDHRVAPLNHVIKDNWVTVCVTHFNHGNFLPNALASLSTQTRPPDEVICIDDGSTCEHSRNIFTKLSDEYTDWQFLTQENIGPGASRNKGLLMAKSPLFLPFDSDNIANPQLILTMLTAMCRRPELAAVTCHALAFSSDSNLNNKLYEYRYSPLGGPRLAALFDNVFGDTCAMFRTDLLRNCEGFESETWSPHEDWETFLKLALTGHEIDNIPLPLLLYRISPSSRLKVLISDPLFKGKHRRHLLRKFFSRSRLSDIEKNQLFEILISDEQRPTTYDFDVAWYESELTKAKKWVKETLQESENWYNKQLAEVKEWHESQAAKEVAEIMAWHESEMLQLNEWHKSEMAKGNSKDV